mmetsp:Transcript_26291/g.41709  ORF Transcript_26291/g.41709 Transcript_26291/m.41709 type:complete len:605 (+) Transcript_26291:32-1846(+)
MELKASKVVAALDFLQSLAQNPSQPIAPKSRSILEEIRKSYVAPSSAKPNSNKHAGKKRKIPPSKLVPKAKRQRTSRAKSKKSDKEENDDDEDEYDIEEGGAEDVQENADETDHDMNEEKLELDTEQQASFGHDKLILIEDSAEQRNIGGDSPSHFSYFGPKEGVFIAEKGALSPLWSRGEPRQNDLDNYLESVAKIFYHPIEAIDQHLNIQKMSEMNKLSEESNTNHNDKNGGKKSKKVRNKKAKNGRNRNEQDEQLEAILRYSTINLILSPLRKRSPLDEWSPREIALFESAMCSKGKQFYEISKIIGTKNTKQCVQFYYHWKQSSHYAVWKALGRKTNKQITKSQRKLHKKIGQKFAEFHDLHTKKLKLSNDDNDKCDAQQQSDHAMNGGKPQQSQPQMQSNMILDHNASILQPQYEYVTNHNGETALLFQPQQQAQATGAFIQYYPGYYQNGYPSWYSNAAYYQQYALQQAPADAANHTNHNHNHKADGSPTNESHPNINGDNAVKATSPNQNSNNSQNLCIDLTETGSSNGSANGAESPEDVKMASPNKANANKKQMNGKDLEKNSKKHSNHKRVSTDIHALTVDKIGVQKQADDVPDV